MFTSNKILGLVLCGGKSERMGSDKGLIKSKTGETWVELCLKKFEAIGMEAVVSINPSQLAFYQALVSKDKIVIDHAPIEGPLKGIISVHSLYPNHDLLIVPCDMPQLSETTLNYLKEYILEQGSAYDFIIFNSVPNSLEPFPGIYTSEGLSKVHKIILAKALQKNSLKHMLEIGNTEELNFVGDEQERANLNFPTQLDS
jgi:molybdopterin-guanine dinucleotide biosynthesis protein A